MEQTAVRKWVMVPADFDEGGACPTSLTPTLTKEDVDLIIQFAKDGKVNERGCLRGRSGHYLDGAHILDCLLKKNSCEHFSRFLELKAIQPEPQPTSTTPKLPKRTQPKRKLKNAIKTSSSKKPKVGHGVSDDWRWSDDDDGAFNFSPTRKRKQKCRTK